MVLRGRDMLMNKLDKFDLKGATLLGVGPMSFNCVDATIELANRHQIPILLIASRRQVEYLAMGGGYVTDTETLANYVKDRDEGGYVILARDHGGPWQGTNEKDLTHSQAMGGALISYGADIAAGFDVIHIDPSLKSRPLEEIVKDVKYLYNNCEIMAKEAGREIIYETGTEEHSGQISDLESFEWFVKEIKKDCPKVRFVVGNMGLHVKEMGNVGTFDEKQAKNLVKICNENGLLLKGHNTDYVGTTVLKKHKRLGIHSANVAPEFGVAETLELQNILPESEWEKFVDIAYESKKWEKWMVDDTPDKEWKAIIAGHYVFNHPEVKALMEPHKDRLKDAVKKNILTYLKAFGWV
jgi:fructose/tagatose bisphosphate aldolase